MQLVWLFLFKIKNMEILRERSFKTPVSTIGPVSIDGKFTCYGLEPRDRDLTSAMTPAQIKLKKVDGETAIAPGRYPITKYYSPDHSTWVLRVLNVIGFDYIEIHIGNYPHDTKGCLLLGTGYAKDMVTNSKVAVDAFYKVVFAALDAGEGVWIIYAEH
jgi:hypothetical protein